MSVPTPPSIEPVPAGEARPLWSVMIPAFNCAKYLRQTLQSVLAQDPGPERMQIEVVDDCSTKDDPEAVVREVGGGRVAFYRQPKNGGAIANFNTCIRRSRGELVHILHGDDYVLPGFYDRIAVEAEKHPEISGFFMRFLTVDEDSAIKTMGGRLQELVEPSRMPGALLYTNGIATPGAVVRRGFYEKYGGFLPHLIHTADWEMWMRIISQGGAVWINELLAAYREFEGNDTSRLVRTAENLRDYLRAGEVFRATQANFDHGHFVRVTAARALHQENVFRAQGDKEAAAANYRLWAELTPLHHQWKGWVKRCVAYRRRRHEAYMKALAEKGEGSR